MKKVIVTGATGNLGQEVVKKLLEENYSVLATFSSKNKTNLTDNHPNLAFQKLDVLDESACAEFSLKHPGTDAIIMLVGGYLGGHFIQASRADIIRMTDLNFFSSFNLVQPFYRQMQSQKKTGHFIFIGSRPGLHASESINNFAYGLAKSLIFRLAETINEEESKTGIKASVIIPGTMDTPENRKSLPAADYSKWVKTEEVADSVAYCLRSDSLKEIVLKVYGGGNK